MWFLSPLPPTAHLAASIVLQTSCKKTEVCIVVTHAQSAMELEAILLAFEIDDKFFHSYQSASYNIYL